MIRLPTPLARLSGALIFATVVSGCGSSGHPAVAQPQKISEKQAKGSVAANIADLYDAAGLTPPKPVKPALATCDQYVQQRQQDYSVSASAVFPMVSSDEAKQAVTKIHDFMAAHGFSGVRLILNENDEYSTEGSKDSQNWGVDYYPQGASHNLTIDGGTGCNVVPDGTDTPPGAS